MALPIRWVIKYAYAVMLPHTRRNKSRSPRYKFEHVTSVNHLSLNILKIVDYRQTQYGISIEGERGGETTRQNEKNTWNDMIPMFVYMFIFVLRFMSLSQSLPAFLFTVRVLGLNDFHLIRSIWIYIYIKRAKHRLTFGAMMVLLPWNSRFGNQSILLCSFDDGFDSASSQILYNFSITILIEKCLCCSPDLETIHVHPTELYSQIHNKNMAFFFSFRTFALYWITYLLPILSIMFDHFFGLIKLH